MSGEQVKPGYKRTEVGVIPEEWGVKRIGDIASVSSGGTPSRENSTYWHGNIPWVTTSQIDFNTITEADQFISEFGLKNSAAKLLPAGTLLMALYGQGKTRGKVGILGFEAATNQACASISPNESVSKKFLLHFLSSRYEAIRNSSNTGSQENLNGQIVKDTPVIFPPLSEQIAIATALSDVDALLAQLDQLIAKKRDLKQATMQQLLTGQTRLPGFSWKWEVKRVDQICSLRTERVDPRIEEAQEFCVELEHIEPASGRLLGSSTASEQASLKTKFKVGDVLFGKLRAYQRKHWIASLPGVCSTEIWVLVSNLEFSTPEFLYHLVSTDDFIDAASTAYGTHMPRSDWKLVRQVQVALPGLDEQTAIATVLSDMDAELATLEARRDKTRALKQGMMQELLTGRIRLV